MFFTNSWNKISEKNYFKHHFTQISRIFILVNTYIEPPFNYSTPFSLVSSWMQSLMRPMIPRIIDHSKLWIVEKVALNMMCVVIPPWSQCVRLILKHANFNVNYNIKGLFWPKSDITQRIFCHWISLWRIVKIWHV